MLKTNETQAALLNKIIKFYYKIKQNLVLRKTMIMTNNTRKNYKLK